MNTIETIMKMARSLFTQSRRKVLASLNEIKPEIKPLYFSEKAALYGVSVSVYNYLILTK